MNSTLKVLASLSILMLTWSSNASAFASAESLSLCEQNSGDFPHNMDGFKRLSGQWSIGKDCIVGEGSGDVLAMSEHRARDFAYEAEITAVRGAAAALVFRSNATGSDAYYATLDVGADGIKLWKTGANASTLEFRDGLGLRLGESYNVKVEARGNEISVFLNGEETLSIVDEDPVRYGQFGLNVFNGESVFSRVRYSSIVAGDWSATGTQLTGSSESDGFITSSDNFKDVIFSADISVPENGKAAALVVRGEFDEEEFDAGYAITLNVEANQLILWGPNVDSAYVDLPLNYNQIYRLRVEAEGELVRAYLNDNLIIQIKDDTYTEGVVGANVYGGPATFRNIRIDNQNALWPLGPDEIGGAFDPVFPAQAVSIPVTGYVNPNFKHVHQVVVDQLAQSKATAAVLEVRKQSGELLVGAGYGWLDKNMTRKTPRNAMMRIASISKSYTLHAIWQLINNDIISKDARAFCFNGELPSGKGCLLPVNPRGGHDLRAEAISVLHLLTHSNGWDEGAPDTNGVRDPLHNSDLIAEIMGVPNPPSYQNLLDYRLGQSLDYPPATSFGSPESGYLPAGDSVYGSYGYTVLSQILEEYSAQGFIDYIRDNITSPAGVRRQDIALGQELVALRDPREPEYISSSTQRVQNKFGPPGDRVFGPDGGGHVGNAMGAGGIITTAPALMRYVRRYQLHRPELRDTKAETRWGFGGSGDGVLAEAASDKDLPGLQTHFDWVWMLNSRHNSEGFYQRLEFAVRNTLRDKVTVNSIEGVTRERRLSGFNLTEDGTTLTFTFSSSGNEDCDETQNWYRTRSYAYDDKVRYKGMLYSATSANSGGEAGETLSAADWRLVGRCVAKPEILIKRDAVPTSSSYDCKAAAAGNTTCEIRNPAAGFYYITIQAKDYDFSGGSIKADFSK